MAIFPVNFQAGASAQMHLHALWVIRQARSRINCNHGISIDGLGQRHGGRVRRVRLRTENYSAAGCKFDNREIAATIMPDRNCMVATSLLSNAWAVDDRTSKTPRVRRKCRNGATRMERTPRRRQVAVST